MISLECKNVFISVHKLLLLIDITSTKKKKTLLIDKWTPYNMHLNSACLNVYTHRNQKKNDIKQTYTSVYRVPVILSINYNLLFSCIYVWCCCNVRLCVQHSLINIKKKSIFILNMFCINLNKVSSSIIFFFLHTQKLNNGELMWN